MRGFLIAFVPRSGSSWLCELLRNAGLGNPREWFHERQLKAAIDGGCATTDEYIAWVKSQGTQHGIFGAKVTWPHFQALVYRGQTPHDVLGMPLLYIFLDRQDRTAQAISDYRAMLSGRFHSTTVGPTQAVPFDAGAIREVAAALDSGRRHFLAWFARHGITPLKLTYEQVQADPLTVLSVIGEAMGRPVSALPATRLERVSGIESIVWAKALEAAGGLGT